MKIQETFQKTGFLSREVKLGIHNVRARSQVSFDFAYDLNELLMRTAIAAMNSAHGHNWTCEAVAIRLLLRTSESFQGVIILSERGIVSPARALVRMIVEDSFCAAALLEKPDEVIRMLRDDAEHSRRKQAAFISEQNLGDDPDVLAELRLTIEAMAKKQRIDWRNMAKISTILPQYLNYQRLSDGAVHTSATSLDRHIARNANSDGWTYRIGPADQGDIDATLHRAFLAAIPVALVVTQVVPNSETNSELAGLSSRFLQLPTGNTV